MPSFVYTHPTLNYFSEKTIRWISHFDGIDTLKECGLLSLEPVTVGETTIVPREFLFALLDPKLQPTPKDGDVTVMLNTIVGENADGAQTKIRRP